ncbi:YciI family protein [Sediminicoccus sp. KRV36]|uniref:YciI family protein n=1 Tax=Sediminicoccus sp. KRV36 TaxID=3133721 RepID=UPI00200F8B58|nr:YciI family protein [Sediminicoccus rosea]UPY37507.1 YciI family protein [Sediminicoccus rosea]
MGYVILGWDGEDAEAPARRAAVRERHLKVITAWAAAGRLNLAVPLFRADGSAAGSIMILNDEDEVGAREYLLEEPFAREGVWLSYQMRPYRIAPMNYQPLPSGPAPSAMTHCVVIAEDAENSLERRMAVREPHMRRVQGFAEDGTMACGGALLGPKGGMIGSIAITRHPTEAAARAWWADDPYVQHGVWHNLRFFPTRFAPLPYVPLPRPA